MKNILICLICLLAISCASKQVLDKPPLNYTFMPSYLDLDSIHIQIPKTPEEVIDTTKLLDFKQFALDSGKLCTKDGILISERKAATYIFYKAGYERQDKELQMAKYMMKEYYDKSKSAEILYQQKILDLEKQAKRGWLERNMGYIGFVAGLATAIITEFAVIKTNK